jgi:hypothetical protein
MKLLLALLLPLTPVAIRAEIAVGESLEWLAVSRLDAGEYKLLESKDRADPGARWIERRFLLKRRRRIKGDPPKRVRFSRQVPLKTKRPGSGRRYLVFFDHRGSVDFVIDLSRPGDTASWERAFSGDFREIRGRRSILRTVRDRVARHEENGWPKVDREKYLSGKPGAGYIKLEAPFNSEAHDRLYAGSAVYLAVPADPERAEKLLEQARDGETAVRARAAWRLANYHTAHTERLLRALLTDPGTSVLTTHDGGRKKERVVYPVRQAAYRALRALGVSVGKPDGFDRNYPDSFLE